jgi:hypothetical protein
MTGDFLTGEVLGSMRREALIRAAQQMADAATGRFLDTVEGVTLVEQDGHIRGATPLELAMRGMLRDLRDYIKQPEGLGPFRYTEALDLIDQMIGGPVGE